MTPLLTTALVLGLAGSLHCIAMCGPLVLSLPGNKSWAKQFSNNLIYQVGRILTYGILGLIIGSVGESLSFIGLQQPLSLTIGSLLLIFLVLPKSIKLSLEKKIGQTKIFTKVRQGWSYFFQKQSTPAFFAVGMLNGLLPCGLVYAALAGALAGGNGINGSVFMLVFGVGTSPALLFGGVFKKVFHSKMQQWRSVLLPTSVAVMALIFILRGANLGIPYLSPEINHTTGQTDCGCEE
ncbi:MAG: sulfite exporter TauE/SafE family protein [Lentisphaeraceae bacterium]|nr:sulfite exporter TauE/SafE family protein [Lentisphaeraceae bacterium]